MYFNICVLPHKKQFGGVPCSFDGFPYLNSFHTSAPGVPWGLQSEGADSPSRAKPVVRQPAGTAAGDNAHVLASLCSHFPGSRLCRLWQARSSDFSVLQMNSLGIQASAECASTEQKSLLFCCGFVSVGGRRALTCSPLRGPSRGCSAWCQLLSAAVLVLALSCLTPGWRLYPEIREGTGRSLLSYKTERGMLLILNQEETNLPKQKRVMQQEFCLWHEQSHVEWLHEN